MRRVAYLGPRGTFAEAALRTLPDGAMIDAVPAASVHAALDMARTGAVDGAVVPIENSVGGAVTLTLDTLSSGEPLVIVDEMVLPVRFALVAPWPTSPELPRTHMHRRRCAVGSQSTCQKLP